MSLFDGRTWADIPYETIPKAMTGCRTLWHAQRLLAEGREEGRKAAKLVADFCTANGIEGEQRINAIREARKRFDVSATQATNAAAHLVKDEEAGFQTLPLGSGIA